LIKKNIQILDLNGKYGIRGEIKLDSDPMNSKMLACASEYIPCCNERELFPNLNEINRGNTSSFLARFLQLETTA
jgi:hypothetical protein